MFIKAATLLTENAATTTEVVEEAQTYAEWAAENQPAVVCGAIFVSGIIVLGILLYKAWKRR